MKHKINTKVTKAALATLVFATTLGATAQAAAISPVKPTIADSNGGSLGHITLTGNEISGKPSINASIAGIKLPEVTEEVIEIHTYEELLQIDQDPSGYYVLKANIHVENNDEAFSVIEETFTGTLNGNGYAIQGLDRPFFNKLHGDVYNLQIEDAHIKRNMSEVGTLARTSQDANVYNVRAEDITIEAGNHRTAGLIGEARDTVIEDVQLLNVDIEGRGFYTGGLVGRAWDSEIHTIVVEGELEIGTTANGGIVGAVREGTVVEDVFADVDVNRVVLSDYRTANAGIIGQFESDDNHLYMSVAYGNMTEGSKGVYKAVWVNDPNIDRETVDGVWQVANTTGLTSSVYGIDVGELDISYFNEEFYENTMRWSDEEWDLTGEPRLLPLEGEENIVFKEELDENTHYIYTFEDLQQIDHNGVNVIMNDIDASSWKYASTVVPGNFTGELDGNGYSIIGLTQPVFEKVSGEISDLGIENATIHRLNGEAGALARFTEGATITDITGDDIAMSGGTHRIASLVGQATDTTFERIDIEGIDVEGSGVYIGGVVGRMFNSHLIDVYAQGEVTVKTTSNGGIAGALRDGATMDGVVSNVAVIRDGVTDSRTQNGGLYGNYETFGNVVKDSIVIADMSEASGNIPGVYKVTDKNDKFGSSNSIENVFEVVEAKGLSSQKTTFTVDTVSEKDLTADFYEDRLRLDTDVWDLTGDVPRLK